jgi:hypothetical protein
MQNLVAYASFLVAVGCKLNLDTETAQLEVVSFPAEKKSKIEPALADIGKFLDTATFVDGMAAFHLSELVDEKPNPLSSKQRIRLLNALGIMRDDKFIAPVLMQTKVNRSWHTSEKANACSYFGEVCTYRGSVVDPNRRGVRSTRKPYEYHPQTSPTTIKREQLITPAMEIAYNLIPANVLVSGKSDQTILHTKIEQQIENMKPEELDTLIKKLTDMREKANANS